MNLPARMTNARTRRRGLPLFVLGGAGIALGLGSFFPARPAMLWNFTASAPLGLYRVENTRPSWGDFVAIDPADGLGAFIPTGILPPGRLLLKPVAGVSGDTICREGSIVSLNGVPAAQALASMPDGRPLPAWTGCRRLAANEFFVLSHHEASFDSRYFGAVGLDHVVGVVRPVFTYPPAPPAEAARQEAGE